MDTNKFLHTDVAEYLQKGSKKQTCISCLKCIKGSKDVVSFKYKGSLKSNYAENFAHHKTERQKQFVLDKERRASKVEYHPPHSYETAYKTTFADRKGSRAVGDPDDGRVKPKELIISPNAIDFSLGKSVYS